MIAIFALAPLIGIFGSSLTTTSYWAFPPHGLTLRWYREFFGSPELVNSLLSSISAALLVGIVGTAIGLMLAVGLARGRIGIRTRDVLRVLVLLPLLVPAISLGVAIFTLYARNSVPINLATLAAAQLILVLPLVVGLLIVGMNTIGPNVERAAANLGAGPFLVFWRVTMPLLRPALIATAILAFIRSFDDAAIALFVNTPNVMTLPVRMLLAMEQDSGPLIAATGSALLLVALGLAVLLDRTIGLSRAFGLRQGATPR
jgi:putative spermidine/putrescine transport system permease protein